MEGTGRDPLGLSRVSDLLTGYLLPGIITTTNRARYYSFYTWTLSEVNASKAAAGKRFSFFAEFQRREAAFAMASQLDPKTDFTIVGSERIKPRLAVAKADGEANTAFQVLNDRMGGFGNYYQGCLRDLGLVEFNENGEWSIPSGIAQDLTNAFGSATRKAPYLSGEWYQKDRVPLDVLKKSAQTFSLDGLRTPPAEAERKLLIQIFFALGQKPTVHNPLIRQATLGQLLHVLHSYAQAGLEITRRNIDWAGLFAPHYYNVIENSERDSCNYAPEECFVEARGYWRQFCAHQFLAHALEGFLAGILDVLAPHSAGLTEIDLIDALVGGDFVEDISQAVGKRCSRPQALLAHLGITTVPDQEVCREIRKKFRVGAALNEWNICWADVNVPKTRMGRSMLLLAILYGKWRGNLEDPAFLALSSKAGSESWIGTIFPWVDDWLENKLDWRSVVTGLLRWICLRHDDVKYRKGKLDASWIDVSDGRWQKEQDLEPYFRASRHRNAITILQDLALIEYCSHDDPLHLTAEGRKVLREVLKLRA